MPRSRRVSYALSGAISSIGAPVGLLALRMAFGSVPSAFDELLTNRVTYSYVFLVSAIAFTLFGYVLGAQADALLLLSTTDPLTGLLNRRAFDERLKLEWRRSQRYLAPLSLLLVDVDGLKQINDRRGHAAGDRAICGVASAIKATLRAGGDTGARWGGDEFTILAPSTDHTAASSLAERLRLRMSTRILGTEGATISIGVAMFDPRRKDLESSSALVEAADTALHDAKAAGRNRVAVA